MPARIIHFGEDRWHRVTVLRRAGHTVEVCETPVELMSTLRTGTDPDAIVISPSRVLDPMTAKSLARAVTPAPVVLFPQNAHDPADPEFDLVIPPLTRPDEWLQEVYELIEHSRALHARSRALCRDAAKLREEARTAVQSSCQQRRATRELNSDPKRMPKNPWTDLE